MASITDLQRAFAALTEKQKHHEEKWAYYDGNAPLVYSTRKLQEIFGKNIDARWQENWCSVVVNSVHERINLSRFEVANDDATAKKLGDIWVNTQMNLDSDDAHLAALVCGESFVIVGLDGSKNVEAYYNDPRLCWIAYDEDRPKVKRFAAKWWVNESTKKRHLNLYYADRTEYWVSRNEANNVQKADGTSFDLSETLPNTTGVIPVFQLRRERRGIKSEITDAIDIQNAINKLFADMMIGSEFATIRQRYIVSNADNLESVLRGVSSTYLLPAGDKDSEPTQVGEFESADIERVTKAMDKLVNDLATITRTPRHYFFKQGGDPSGEALIAMEAPLVKKASAYIERWQSGWSEIAAYMLQLSGVSIQPSAIKPIFDNPETVQPRTRAEIREIEVRTGLPLQTVLAREGGWTEQDIKDMEAEQAKERTARAEERATALGAAGAFFDRGSANAR